MPLLFVFIDGLGLGAPDPETNPFMHARMPHLKALTGLSRLTAMDVPYRSALAEIRAIDACLGVPGLPQSASGQTAILTGQNAPAILGHHQSGYPTPTLVRILEEHSVFLQLKQLGHSSAFANTFTREYFERVESRVGRARHSATTTAALSGGVELGLIDSYSAGKTISYDITGEVLRSFGYPVEIRSPQEAGRVLARLLRKRDFVLFEFFLTDRAGHKQDMEEAIRLLERIDGLLGGILEEMSWTDDTLLITSDHGNVEDLSTRTHTRNAVPLIVAGAGRQKFADQVNDLTHLTPAIVRQAAGIGQADLSRD